MLLHPPRTRFLAVTVSVLFLPPSGIRIQAKCRWHMTAHCTAHAGASAVGEGASMTGYLPQLLHLLWLPMLLCLLLLLLLLPLLRILLLLLKVV